MMMFGGLGRRQDSGPVEGLGKVNNMGYRQILYVIDLQMISNVPRAGAPVVEVKPGQ